MYFLEKINAYRKSLKPWLFEKEYKKVSRSMSIFTDHSVGLGQCFKPLGIVYAYFVSIQVQVSSSSSKGFSSNYFVFPISYLARPRSKSKLKWQVQVQHFCTS